MKKPFNLFDDKNIYLGLGLLSLFDGALLWFTGGTFLSTVLRDANPKEEIFPVFFRVLVGFLLIGRAMYLNRK